MPTTTKHDNFLADSIRPRTAPGLRLGYGDGLRFGLGFITAWLLVAVVVGGGAWGIMVLLHH